MSALFSNNFSEDEELSELYQEFFNQPSDVWAKNIHAIADLFIVKPRNSLGCCGPKKLTLKNLDDYIVETIFRYMSAQADSTRIAKFSQHEDLCLKAILRQFSLFVNHDHDLSSLKKLYEEEDTELNQDTQNEEEKEAEDDGIEEDNNGSIITPTGSFFEGFSPPYEFNHLGMIFGSDCDYMVYPQHFHGADKKVDTQNHFFLIEHNTKKEGYVNVTINMDFLKSKMSLGLATGWLPCNSKFFSQEKYLDSNSVVELLNREDGAHGPALLVSDEGDADIRMLGRVYRDHVYCLHVKCWPDIAQEWVSRTRPYQWPAQEVLDKVLQEGCHVVPIGIPGKLGRGPEWRLSFSLAEIQLAHHLSEEMVSVYGLLKYIFKNELTKQLSVKSYFLKNIFFWSCETKPKEFWRRENIAHCLLYLIEKTEQHCASGQLLHYFVPQNNLMTFEEPQVLRRNAEILQEMRTNAFIFAPIFLIPVSYTHLTLPTILLV